MVKRTSHTTGRSWEDEGGYSRAVRVGDLVFVSATAATDADGQVVAKGDVYAQARVSLAIIEEALKSVGSSLDDVVAVRFNLADASRWADATRAHVEVFGEVRPTFSFVFVQPFPLDGLTIEVEVTAVAGSAA